MASETPNPLTTVLLVALASGGGGIGLGSFVGSPPTTIELSAEASKAFKESAEAEALRANILARIEDAVVKNGIEVSEFRNELGSIRMEVRDLQRDSKEQSGMSKRLDERIRLIERSYAPPFVSDSP
jgi:hypothetical protein